MELQQYRLLAIFTWGMVTPNAFFSPSSEPNELIFFNTMFYDIVHA